MFKNTIYIYITTVLSNILCMAMPFEDMCLTRTMICFDHPKLDAVDKYLIRSTLSLVHHHIQTCWAYGLVTRSENPKFAHQHINVVCGLLILHILSLHTSIFKSSCGLGPRPFPNREVSTPAKLNMLALRATHFPDSEVCTPADSNMLGLRSTHYPEIPSLVCTPAY